MPSDVVIPSPSCPAAIQSPGVGSHAPMSGSLSGVAGRKPVHVRITDRLRERRHELDRAREHARQHARLSDASQPTSSRDEPISTCPVARGCTLNATDSVVIACALVR